MLTVSACNCLIFQIIRKLVDFFRIDPRQETDIMGFYPKPAFPGLPPDLQNTRLLRKGSFSGSIVSVVRI